MQTTIENPIMTIESKEENPLKGGIMSKKVEIYFRDLTPKAQSHLLKEFEITAEEENWDVFPIGQVDRSTKTLPRPTVARR